MKSANRFKQREEFRFMFSSEPRQAFVGGGNKMSQSLVKILGTLTLNPWKVVVFVLFKTKRSSTRTKKPLVIFVKSLKQIAKVL